MFFNKNLKYLRKKERNLSQDALAEMLGISRSALVSYESGRAEPRLLVLIQIAHYFNISIEELVNRDLTGYRK